MAEIIKLSEEYITLGQFLKLSRIIVSGSEAKYYLNTHEIFVNGEPEQRRGRKLYPGDEIIADGKGFIIE